MEIMTMTQGEMRWGQRNSRMLLNEVYFWADTIKDGHKLLDDDFNKNVIIGSWRWSSSKLYETGIDEFNILTDYRERFGQI